MDLSLSVDLKDQVAIVTGASQGLGRAVAVALGQNGAHVVCVARNAEKLAATVAEIEAAGGKAKPCLVTSPIAKLPPKPSRELTKNTVAWISWSTTPGSLATS